MLDPKYVFYVQEVSPINKNKLRIILSNSRYSNGIHIEFCGTELNMDASLVGTYDEKLKNELRKIYGFAPYNLKDINKKKRENPQIVLY